MLYCMYTLCTVYIYTMYFICMICTLYVWYVLYMYGMYFICMVCTMFYIFMYGIGYYAVIHL